MKHTEPLWDLEYHICTSLDLDRFQTVVRTPNLSEETIKELENIRFYNFPRGVSIRTEFNLSQFPPAFRFFPLSCPSPDGEPQYGLARTIYVGTNRAGRIGNTLTHSFVLKQSQLEQIHFNVGQLCNSLPFYPQKYEGNGDEILSPLPVTPCLEQSRELLKELLEKWGAGKFGAFVETTCQAIEQNRLLFVVSDRLFSEVYLPGMILALPPAFRKQLTFTTNESENYLRSKWQPFRVVIFTPETRLPPSIQRDGEVFDLRGEVMASAEEKGSYVRFLIEKMSSASEEDWNRWDDFIHYLASLKLPVSQKWHNQQTVYWLNRDAPDALDYYKAAALLFEQRNHSTVCTVVSQDMSRRIIQLLEQGWRGVEDALKLYDLWSRFLQGVASTEVAPGYEETTCLLFDRLIRPRLQTAQLKQSTKSLMHASPDLIFACLLKMQDSRKAFWALEAQEQSALQTSETVKCLAQCVTVLSERIAGAISLRFDLMKLVFNVLTHIPVPYIPTTILAECFSSLVLPRPQRPERYRELLNWLIDANYQELFVDLVTRVPLEWLSLDDNPHYVQTMTHLDPAVYHQLIAGLTRYDQPHGEKGLADLFLHLYTITTAGYRNELIREFLLAVVEDKQMLDYRLDCIQTLIQRLWGFRNERAKDVEPILTVQLEALRAVKQLWEKGKIEHFEYLFRKSASSLQPETRAAFYRGLCGTLNRSVLVLCPDTLSLLRFYLECESQPWENVHQPGDILFNTIVQGASKQGASKQAPDWNLIIEMTTKAMTETRMNFLFDQWLDNVLSQCGWITLRDYKSLVQKQGRFSSAVLKIWENRIERARQKRPGFFGRR